MKHIILLFVLLSSAHADWRELDSSDFTVGAAPIAGSATDKKDFKKLHEYQDSDREADCKIAKTQEFMTPASMFGPATKQLSKKEFAAVEPLLNDVKKLVSDITEDFKVKYQRPRPFNIDTDLQPCVKKPGGAKAYPSSHASVGMAGGLVLAKIFPDKADALEEQGLKVGELRVIAGVHHPSDVVAGQDLARQIVDEISKDKDFKAEIKAIKDGL